MSQRLRRQVRIPVFNPTDFADRVEVFGHFYNFEPLGVGTCSCTQHNIPGAVDNVGCHEVLEHSRDEKNRIVFDLPLKVANEGTATADTVADFITAQECRGAKGFIRLEGSPAEQARQKAEAREKWVGYYIHIVEEKIAIWEAHVANLKTVSPGAQAPRRPRDIADAYEWRRKHREIVETAPRAKHVCATCGYENESPKAVADHILADHPGIAHEAVHAGALAAAAPPPAPAAPGEKPQSGIGLRLIKRAEAAGLELSVADKKGLTHGDPDVADDVSDRLEAMRQKARENAATATAARKGAKAKEEIPAEAAAAGA